MAEQVPTGPRPYLLAILLCDNIITEAGSGKRSLIGVFDQLWAKRFPTIHPIHIYFRITDARGRYQFKIQFVQIDADKVLGEGISDPLEIPDRLGSFDFAVPIPAPVPAPGLYEVRLYANEAYVGHITFRASLKEEQNA